MTRISLSNFVRSAGRVLAVGMFVVPGQAFAEDPELAVIGDTSITTSQNDNSNGNAGLGLDLNVPKFGVYALVGGGVSATISGTKDEDLRKGVAEAIQGGFGGVLDFRYSPWGTFSTNDFSLKSGAYVRGRIDYWRHQFALTDSSGTSTNKDLDLLSPRLAIGYWGDARAMAVAGGVAADKIGKWDKLGFGVEFGPTVRALASADDDVKSAVGHARVGIVTVVYVQVNALRAQIDIPCFFGGGEGFRGCAATVVVGGRADLVSTK